MTGTATSLHRRTHRKWICEPRRDFFARKLRAAWAKSDPVAAERALHAPAERNEIMTWHTGPLAVLDLEATGVDPATARIVEVALYVVDQYGNADPIVDTLVNPGVPMPADAAAVTGITTADLEARGANPATILGQTVGALDGLAREGVPIVIYNATYDWPLLAAELARDGLPILPNVPPAVIVDPLVLDRHVDRYRKGKRTLAATAKHYGVRLDGAHRATADAMVALAVTRALAARYPAVLGVDGPDLVVLQVAAHRAWRDSFNAYLRSSGAEGEPVSGDWPGMQDRPMNPNHDPVRHA